MECKMSAKSNVVLAFTGYKLATVKKNSNPEHQRLENGRKHVRELRDQTFTDITPGDIYYLTEHLVEAVTGKVTPIMDCSEEELKIVAVCGDLTLIISAINCDEWDESNGATELSVTVSINTARTFAAPELQMHQASVAKNIRYVSVGKKLVNIETQVNFNFGASMALMESAIISVLLAATNLAAYQ
jgi:hypothetical protein